MFACDKKMHLSAYALLVLKIKVIWPLVFAYGTCILMTKKHNAFFFLVITNIFSETMQRYAVSVNASVDRDVSQFDIP